MREAKKFEWDISQVKKVFVHSISPDVKIVRNVERKISLEVELSGFKKDIEEYEPKVRKEGERFELDLFPHSQFFPDGFFAFGFMKFGGLEIEDVYLKIPDDLSTGIDTTSGDLSINGLSFDELRISSVSGEIEIDSKVKNLFVKTTSGNLNFRGSSRIEKIDVQSISGDLEFSNPSFRLGIIKTTSSDIKITGMDPDFETLDVRTISGDFSISFKSRPNTHVEIDTVSGNIRSDVKVKGIVKGSFDVGKPSSTLKFKSISGDAHLEFGFDIVNSKDDERLKIFEEILKSKRATKDEIRELMETLGYSKEKIEEFLSGK
ncbi:DUF4097 family beta strand repeat-containing protein [Athalassotoga saccharophila]|uniref:DUF4097 family beta strand repeat-containing protein n=1 Tax=Athalassotoga saccharophila TaxID=1441386 RepID=UPI001379867C|nr:DUF4097 family beta strand repeat-containing protein [Athalassotoga saccharophila]BBJ27605.1 hypothetical protein ATHSA_0481 [Athalassotoga saccharophila]